MKLFTFFTPRGTNPLTPLDFPRLEIKTSRHTVIKPVYHPDQSDGERIQVNSRGRPSNQGEINPPRFLEIKENDELEDGRVPIRRKYSLEFHRTR